MSNSPTVAELLAALPDDHEGDDAPMQIDPKALADLFAELAERPAPVGAFRRLFVLGGLNARLGLAYLAYWLRGWMRDADARQRDLAETNLRAAFGVLRTAGYLRGAAMKVGQLAACFPNIVPDQFVQALQMLHFQAPPMHFELLREMVRNELGDDPENVFATFETKAFAAASLGQVHRATLKDGTPVAVKVQYPGIARTIRSDFRSLMAFASPVRLTRDWEATKAQLDDLFRTLERETDYEQEARFQEQARSVFTEDDGIVVPRVYTELSTRRVLTMDFLGGDHMDAFMARQPSQALRDSFGEKLMVAWYRIYYRCKLEYADCHPGNFLFMPDGRLGLLDFGCMITFSDEDWEVLRLADVALTTGQPQDMRAFFINWAQIDDPAAEADRIELATRYVQWSWRPRTDRRVYDFGDAAQFREGIDLFIELARKRYTRGRPSSPMVARWDMASRALLYRLGAKFDMTPLAEREVGAMGWDRSGYAG